MSCIRALTSSSSLQFSIFARSCYGDKSEFSLNYFWCLLFHAIFKFTRSRPKLECQDIQILGEELMCGFQTFTIILLTHVNNIILPILISAMPPTAKRMHIIKGSIIDKCKGLSNLDGGCTLCWGEHELFGQGSASDFGILAIAIIILILKTGASGRTWISTDAYTFNVMLSFNVAMAIPMLCVPYSVCCFTIRYVHTGVHMMLPVLGRGAVTFIQLFVPRGIHSTISRDISAGSWLVFPGIRSWRTITHVAIMIST
jgi:hypothetical protein